MNSNERWENIRAKNGKIRMTEPLLADLKSEIESASQEHASGIYGTRADVKNTRYCFWEGQSSDGRKHSDANDGESVMPFEGACDGRYRISDMLVNEDVMLVVLASLRARVTVKGTDSTDSAYAGRMTILLRWVLQNVFRYRYLRELIKLANYCFGDSPAVGFMNVTWRREMALELKELTSEELIDMYTAQVTNGLMLEALISQGAEEAAPLSEEGQQMIMEQAEVAATNFRTALEDEMHPEDGIVDTLMTFFPDLKPARAARVVKDLRKTGRTKFPVPYVRRDEPDISAKRLYEDWFVPVDTRDFQKARMYFEPEWLSKTEIRERQISDGWSDEFIKEVIGDENGTGGHETEGKFKEYIRTDTGRLVFNDSISYKGLYQIITVTFMASDEDGIPGRWTVPIHMDVNVAAKDAELLGHAHGLYPGHAFQREVLTDRLLDSRGVVELSATQQGMIKLFHDSFGDVGQLSGAPPIITRGRRSMSQLLIAPLMELPAKRDGAYEFMRPPEYPRTINEILKEHRRMIDEYHGRTNPEVPNDLVQMHKEFKVAWWLSNLREVLIMILQMCQQYMPDEMIRRVTNSQGMPMMRNRAEIQGQFDLEVTFDPRDMDPEHLKLIGGVVKDLLMAMDRDQTIQAAPVVASPFWRLSPDLAQESLRSVSEAMASEIEDELKQYQLIRSGVEPTMVDDGSQNYALRLNMYREQESANPAIYESMSEDQRAILAARLQHLQVMSQQYGENVQIGRAGAKRATGGQT